MLPGLTLSIFASAGAAGSASAASPPKSASRRLAGSAWPTAGATRGETPTRSAEVQATAEGAAYDEEELLRLLRLARIGCAKIFAAQDVATGR